ncbi:hypothetical protein DSO57_1007676 [Entomophthora muscae]|uniref:Uncharacterized protein n=1 Tax=Entomophthora muscae TaxID=34485 RepID=A0ACC2T7E3_9FUNG|nr:hypothetical protein DSO57_1007676 [Entomophthora muscae]
MVLAELSSDIPGTMSEFLLQIKAGTEQRNKTAETIQNLPTITKDKLLEFLAAKVIKSPHRSKISVHVVPETDQTVSSNSTHCCGHLIQDYETFHELVFKPEISH